MFRVLSILICLLGFPIIAQDCKYRLEGEIFDGETNEKLIGAVIAIKNLNLAVESNHNGSYQFINLCADTLTIEVTYGTYKKYTTLLKLKHDFHFDIQLHSEVCELESVEITHKQELYNTLNNSTLSEDDLDKQRGKSLGEVLKSITGVDAIQTGPNVFKPTIQGFSGNRIVIIQNHVRLEGQNWGNDHAPEIDPFSTNKITVIKGANSLMYGPEAQSGAIVIEPFKAPKNHGVRSTLFTNYQTNNRMLQNAAQIVISSHKFHGWYLHLQGSHKYGGNIKTHSHFMDNTASRELNGTTHIGYSTSKQHLRFTYSTFNQKLGIYRGAHIGNLEDLIKNLEGNGYSNKNIFSYDINRSYQDSKHNLLQADYSYSFAKGSSLQALVTYQNNVREEYDIHRPKTDQGDAPNISYKLETIQGELIYNHRIIKNNLRKSGIQLFQQGNITKTTDLRAFIPNFISKNVGLYHIHSVVLNKTQLDLGIRYDLRNITIYKYTNKILVEPQRTYHALSGSFGINHSISKNSTLIYNSAYSMRPPAINELFSDGLHHGESIFIANSNIGFSFNTENTLSNTLSLELHKKHTKQYISVFYNRINNFIHLKPTAPVISIRGAFPTFYYIQSNASMMGIDLKNQWDFHKNWTLETKGSIVMGKELQTNDYILNTPAPKLSNALSYKIKDYKRLKSNQIEIGYTYQFRQIFFPKYKFDINYNTVEGPKTFSIIGDYMAPPQAYGIFNMAFNTQISLKHTKLDLYVSANNLLNTKYRNYLNRFRYYTDEQGFNCSISIKASL